MRLGIIGVGVAGQLHMRNILDGYCPEIRLTAITSSRIHALPEIEGRSVRIFSNIDDMLDSNLVDAVLIATPHPSHRKLAIACFERKLPVMLEKPAGVDVQSVRAMIDAADKADVPFGIMFNQRTNPLYKRMRQLVLSSEYGSIRRIQWTATNWYRSQSYYESAAWRGTWQGEGGGVLLNQAHHNLDIWQWICGMPTAIYAHLLFGSGHDIEVEDDATVCMIYDTGVIGVLTASTADHCGVERFEITMEEARITVEDNQLRVILPGGKTSFEMTYDPANHRQHAELLNNFTRAVQKGASLIADGMDGLHDIELVNAAYLSAWTRNRVSLPLEEKNLQFFDKKLAALKVNT